MLAELVHDLGLLRAKLVHHLVGYDALANGVQQLVQLRDENLLQLLQFAVHWS